MTQILKVLNDERQPQGSVMLEQQWQLAKSYDWLCLEQNRLHYEKKLHIY